MDTISFPIGVERWVALRTAARWEKKLADSLAAVGVPVFLPLLSRITTYKDKQREARVPVFGGYVFASETDFIGSRAVTPGVRAKVAQVLKPPNPDKLRAELLAMAELLTDRVLVQERLVGRVGDVVRIVGGPLTGYAGTVVKAKPNKWQLVLEVSFLGARLEIEVDERLVERILD